MNSPNFAQLLTLHMERAGISDSELARAIGVQRQTIFRWKEGLVSRPRVRDDILHIARKLRLTADECDQLLLAAGFPPERLAVSDQPPPPDPAPTPDAFALAAPPEAPVVATDAEPQPPPATFDHSAASAADQGPWGRRWATPWRIVLALLVAGALLIGALTAGRLLPWPPPPPTATMTVAAVTYPLARPGLPLILVAQFNGYTAQQYNVAGRVVEELEKEIAASQLISTTVAIWPDPVRQTADAQAALQQSKAAAIIWGEYDSGRVRAALTLSEQLNTQHLDFALSSPDDLMTTINQQVPAEVRMFALLTMGTVYQLNRFYADSGRKYREALELNPASQKTRALLNFYLANTVSKTGALSAYDEAIGYDSAALALNPQLHMALYNRGTLWYKRSQLLAPHDPQVTENLDAAIADFSATLAARPDYLPAYQNRGIAYYERNQPGDQQLAIQDFDQLVKRQGRSPHGYYNRAFAYLRNNDYTNWQADLKMTLALSPTYPAVHYALCWGYALEAMAEEALPYCEEAVARDPSGASQDGRAIALAQLGRYAEAATDLRRYVAWARRQQPATRFERQHGPQAQRWILSLDRKVNPFTSATLAALH